MMEPLLLLVKNSLKYKSMHPKIYVLFLIFALNASYCSAQIPSIIDDKDGFTYVRESESLKAKVVGEISDNEIFWADGRDLEDTNLDWVEINYIKDDSTSCNKEIKSGYIHKSRIKNIFSLESVALAEKISSERVVFEDNDNNLCVDIKKDSCIENCLLSLKTLNCYWGTDGNIPNYEISFIKVEIGSNEFFLSKEKVTGIFEPNLNKSFVRYDGENIFIIMHNSDGAGFYTVVWSINSRGSVKRYVNNFSW